MKALFNDKLVEDHLIVSINNRALQFGDGLFETIIGNKTTLPLLKLHYDRLMHGVKVLSLNVSLTFNEFESKILKVIEANHAHDFSRVKFIIWRGDDQQQGYGSGSTKTDVLIIIKPCAKPSLKIIEKADFSQNVKLVYHSFSTLKTISALPYIMASLERKNRGLDELLLTDSQGAISECVSSNIFWIGQNQLYTSSLKSGCIAGVMRQHLINILNSNGITVQEVMILKEELLKAELIFTSNVAGIGIIKTLEGHSFPTSHKLFDQIKQLLAL